jgi:hypothetical protein
MNMRFDTNYYRYACMFKEEILKIGMDDGSDEWDFMGDSICVGDVAYTGYLYFLYPNGSLREYTRFKEGFALGDEYEFYENTMPKRYSQLKHASKHGLHIEWSLEGKVLLEEFYEYNNCLWRRKLDDKGGYIEEDIPLTSHGELQLRLGLDRHTWIDKRFEDKLVQSLNKNPL